jgi:hypothetical protein
MLNSCSSERKHNSGVLARFGKTVTSIVRPAYVCGPHDNTDSFTYWARRMADGGDVVVRDVTTLAPSVVRGRHCRRRRLAGHHPCRYAQRIGAHR